MTAAISRSLTLAGERRKAEDSETSQRQQRQLEEEGEDRLSAMLMTADEVSVAARRLLLLLLLLCCRSLLLLQLVLLCLLLLRSVAVGQLSDVTADEAEASRGRWRRRVTAVRCLPRLHSAEQLLEMAGQDGAEVWTGRIVCCCRGCGSGCRLLGDSRGLLVAQRLSLLRLLLQVLTHPR